MLKNLPSSCSTRTCTQFHWKLGLEFDADPWWRWWLSVGEQSISKSSAKWRSQFLTFFLDPERWSPHHSPLTSLMLPFIIQQCTEKIWTKVYSYTFTHTSWYKSQPPIILGRTKVLFSFAHIVWQMIRTMHGNSWLWRCTSTHLDSSRGSRIGVIQEWDTEKYSCQKKAYSSEIQT